MFVKIKKLLDGVNITYSERNDNRVNLYSYNDIIIPSGKMEMIKTGIEIDSADNEYEYEIQIKSNNIIALRNGIIALSDPIILSNGEIAVVLYNTSDKPFGVSKGMKICQMTLCKTIKINIIGE